ncbi:NAD-dependent epimerase/dehydratase family protein [Flammeovirga sp. MY04]|uniref:NAD-dependent epimerase/dehydratase family protein n=1 Tax=Flammeovirga sp. MY04 TaxID=1191459 RepID=UPI0008061649|nr:NAD-dependent epimerase/dehydratase family protein [Flammeovirga sp. MY04]ANQ50587.1 NAD-dependent epimerase/dehydratase family protein [Flammeovirga sp. MY04]
MQLEGKKVFITGATGFVGGYITRTLHQQKAKIIALKGRKNDTSFIEDIKDDIQWEEADILDPNTLKEALQGVDYIVHTASIVSFEKGLEELRSVNVDGTANLVNMALEANVEKFIHISSIAALGVPEFGNEIDENSKWTGEKGVSAYGISKYNAEQEVWRGYREGLKVVVLNPSVILGVGDFSRSSLAIFQTVKKGLKYYPTGFFSSVDIRDVVDAVVKVFDEQISGERFILNAHSIPYKKALELMADGLNVAPPKKKISKKLTQLASSFEGFISLFTGKQKKLTKDVVRTMYTQNVYKSDKAMSTLQLQFKPLEETMNWVKTHQN